MRLQLTVMNWAHSKCFCFYYVIQSMNTQENLGQVTNTFITFTFNFIKRKQTFFLYANNVEQKINAYQQTITFAASHR